MMLNIMVISTMPDNMLSAPHLGTWQMVNIFQWSFNFLSHYVEHYDL